MKVVAGADVRPHAIRLPYAASLLKIRLIGYKLWETKALTCLCLGPTPDKFKPSRP